MTVVHDEGFEPETIIEYLTDPHDGSLIPDFCEWAPGPRADGYEGPFIRKVYANHLEGVGR